MGRYGAVFALLACGGLVSGVEVYRYRYSARRESINIYSFCRGSVSTIIGWHSYYICIQAEIAHFKIAGRVGEAVAYCSALGVFYFNLDHLRGRTIRQSHAYAYSPGWLRLSGYPNRLQNQDCNKQANELGKDIAY